MDHLHCASFGEFEQGAPVLAALRERAPERPILLTFFSPSGIESVPPDAADHVDYLPLDSPRAMRRFQALIPADTVLIKYELWPGLLSARLEAGCRVHLVAARFDRGRFPANRWGSGIRSLLSAFTTVQVQDDESKAIMARFGIDCDVTGDSRVDRVLDTVSRPAGDKVQVQLNRLSTWIGERKLLIVGSAWPWGMASPARLHWAARTGASLSPPRSRKSRRCGVGLRLGISENLPAPGGKSALF